METNVKNASCETTFKNNAKWNVHGLGAAVARKRRGTEKNKTTVSVLCLLPMWHRGPGCHGEQKGSWYLSQPVWSDIASPGKTEAAAAGFAAAAAAAAGAASSACATFGRTFETYLRSSTRPAARPGQSPSVKAASAFSLGFP